MTALHYECDAILTTNKNNQSNGWNCEFLKRQGSEAKRWIARVGSEETPTKAESETLARRIREKWFTITWIDREMSARRVGR
jgi:hypothetical protein